MYEAFFGLHNRPFSPLPRVETYIPVAPIREPFDSLVRCVTQEQGIGVLTAPTGAGKSLICRLLQKRFSDQRRTILLTTARFPTRRALLQAILFELKHPFVGLSEQEARLHILDLLQASPAPQNRMLLIVDEAHLLSSRGLEELRTLTDYEIAGKPCVSLILSGQLELEELLTSPDMNAFNQRVGCHACIEPLTFEESGQYLRERLRHAGNDGLTIFTPEAIQLICSASEGNPRRLNQLSDHSLLLGYAEETRPVDVSVVRSALLDLRELPLHWNAPLDLTWSDDRNPLEKFAEDHESNEASQLDDLLTECDTDIDIDDQAAFGTSDPHGPVDSDASVFEVGSPLDTASLEQLFEVTRFVVPGEPTNPTEASAWPTTWEESPAPATCAYETAPPGDGHTADAASEFESKDETMIQESHAAPALEHDHDMELGHMTSPESTDSLATNASRTEFEESMVDDVYAAIDRQLESSQPRSHTPPQMQTLEVSSTVPMSELVDTHEDIDGTPFEAVHTSRQIESPADDELEISDVQPMLDEIQLLNFIHEISVDVRQFRQETEASRTLPHSTDTSATSGHAPPQPRHQSLRQSLNWQFDVVEPESVGSVPDQACDQPNWQTPIESQPANHITTESVEATSHLTPVAPTDNSDDATKAPSERPYAQLFTRLQRQRRRVETVISRDR